MKKLLPAILFLLATNCFALPGAKMPIRNGTLENDLNAQGHKILNLDASTSPTNLPFSNLAGTATAAQLGTGTADMTKFLRGDLTWAAPTGGGGGSGFVANVLDYGAKADAKTLLDITMAASSNVVTSAGYTFVNADINKVVVIRGATRGQGGISPLIGHIVSVNGHSATLNVSTGTGGLNNVQPNSFPRMDFGTDNCWFFVLACYAIPGPGQRDHDCPVHVNGVCSPLEFTGAGVMNPILPGDGGTVFIPAGRYMMVSESLGSFWWFETNNIHILGAGMGETVLYCESNPVVAYFPCHLSGGFTTSHGKFQNVTYSDFTIWDLNYYFGGGNSLNVWQTDNLKIERVEAVNGKGNGCINVQGYPSGDSHKIWIQDCWVHGYTEDGFWIEPSTGFPYGIEGDGMNVGEVTDVHILNNRIEGTARHGYEGGGRCVDQVFSGNVIDMKGRGLSGINPTGGSSTTCIGNIVKNCGYFGIDFTTDIGNFVVDGVTCFGNQILNFSGQAAFRFQNTGGDYNNRHIDNVIVDGNLVTNGSNIYSAGVLIGGGGTNQGMNLLIANNQFNVTGVILSDSGNGFNNDAGKYYIIRNNFTAGSITGSFPQNMILEGNTALDPSGSMGNRYGGKTIINLNTTVAAGATVSQSATTLGAFVGDTVDVHRNAGCAAGLILWGIVTAYQEVTVYCYNPTGGSLSTGTQQIYSEIHRASVP